MKFSKNDADVLTIGKHLSIVMNLEVVANEELEVLARDFLTLAGVTMDSKIHHMMKQLLFGDSFSIQVLLINYILQYNFSKPIISRKLRITSDGAHLDATVFRNVKTLESERIPFHIKDFSYYCDTFVCLDNLESIRNGAGTDLLLRVLDRIAAPVLIEAGFLHYGDLEIEERDHSDSGILDRLIRKYESLGFRNVNDRIGNYENACAMLYDKYSPVYFQRKIQF